MKVVFTAWLAIGFFFCHSQSKFNQEFITLQNGDTLKGTVTISSQNFKLVKFSEASGNTRDYSLSEISSLYDREWGQFTLLKVSLRVESAHGETVQTEPVQLFFEKVAEVNHIKLYYFKNGKYGDHYFIQKGSADPVELLNNEKRTEVAGRQATYKDQAYKKTLLENLAGCNAVENPISASKLSKKNLYQVFTIYAQCFPKESNYQSELDKGEWSVGILAGGYSSSVKYKIAQSTDVREVHDSKGSSGFTAGLVANYLISQKRRRFSVGVELVYRKLEVTQNLAVQSSVPPFLFDEMRHYKFDYLRFNMIGRYTFQVKSPIKPFLVFGISNSFAVTQSTQIHNLATGRESNGQKMRAYEQGLILGTGVNYKKFDVFARYELSNGFLISNQQGKMSINTISYGLIYSF